MGTSTASENPAVMWGTPSAPVVDFGAHYYPEIPGPLAGKHGEIERYDGSAVCTDLDALLGRYDEAGVDAAVLSQPFYMGAADAEAAAAANDALLDAVEAHDGLYGLAAIPTAAGGEAAAREFERSLGAGYHGGVLETESEGIELVDRGVEPVLEVADRTGAPVLVHPKLHDSLGAGVLDDRWRLNAIFGREVALAESVCKVIHEGVLERYPDLSLVYHHNGGNVASMLDRIELSLNRAHRSGGGELKPSGEFARLLESRLYFDTSGYFGGDAPFRATLEAVPASRALFATDFPYETLAPATFRKIAGAIDRLTPDSETDAILGGNALDLLVNAG